MSKRYLSHLLLLISAFIFGYNYWISKWLTNDLSVEVVVLWRVIGAGLLFWIFSFFQKKEKVKPKDMLALAAAGLIGIAINQIFFFSGIALSNPVDVSIIHVTNPFFVLVLSLLFLKTKLNLIKIIGLVLGAAGALLLILKSGQVDFTKETLKGNILILINTVAYAAYLIISKPILSRYSTFTVMKWISLWGIVFILPYAAQEAWLTDYAAVPTNTWFSMLYLVVMVTFLAYFFSAFALKNLSATTVSYYIYLQPLIVAVLSFILGESIPGWHHAIAATFIFSGVYLVSLRSKKRRTATT
jgi:drug/metabolite transporter (DMT)-like permease